MIMFNVTDFIKLIARQWENIKTGSPQGDQQLYDFMSIAAAHDLMMERQVRHEEIARAAGWKEAEMTPGLLVKGIPGQAMAEAAGSWEDACEVSGLDVPYSPMLLVWAVSDIMFAQLSLLGENISEVCGNKLWADWRDPEAASIFIAKMSDDILKPKWVEAIAKVMKKLEANDLYLPLGKETLVEQDARDRWEQNSG